jgi:hypothetical protein
MKTILLLSFLLIFGIVSVDGQITWQKQAGPYGGGVTDVVVHPTNFTVYALGADRSLYRSTDSGLNWIKHEPVTFGQDLGQINDIEMLSDGTLFALSYNNLYKSIDDGANWTKVNSVSGSAAGGFDSGSKIAKNQLYGTLYVVGYRNSNVTVLRSTNNGSTWSVGFQSRNFTQIVSTQTGDVYATEGYGAALWKSTDDGSNFTQVAAPSPDAGSIYSLISTSNGSQLYISTGISSMFSLSTPFTTWVQLAETNITLADQSTYGSYSVLQLSPDNATLFLLDNTNNKFYSSPTSSISWTQKSTAFVNAAGDNGTCMAVKDASTLYVGTYDNGLWRSINGGAGWIEFDSGIEAVYANSMAVADDNSIIVAGQRTYRSAGPTSGSSWALINTSGNSYYTILKGATGSPKPLFLFGANALQSANNGSSWSAITAPPVGASSFASNDGVKIIAYNNTQIYYSSNSGTSWSAVLSISGLPGSYSFRKIVLDQNAVLYAFLSDYSSVYKITLSPNTTSPTTGAATLISLATIGVTGINDIAYLNNKVYVLGYTNSADVLSMTSNAGTSWTAKPGSGGYRLDVDPVNKYLFVTNSNNSTYTINISRDDGDSYISTATGASNKSQIAGVGIDPTGIAYAAFAYSSVFKTKATIVTPVAPTGLISSGATSDRLTLRWLDNATNETHYVIEQFNGSTYDNIDTVGSGSNPAQKMYVQVRNLLPSTSYQFRVAAINDGGSSSYVTLTTSTTALCASSIPDNKSWNGTINATSVTNVSIKSLGNGSYSISELSGGAVVGGNATISGSFIESCNSTYLSSNNGSLWSNGTGTWASGTNTLVLKWITDGYMATETVGTVTLVKNASDPAPAAPSSTSAYVYSNSSIEISWIGSAFETQYLVERSTDNFATVAQTLTVNYPATTVIDNGLVLNTVYYYRVKAKNSAGTSAASNITNVTLTKPNFVLSNTIVETTSSVSTTGAIWGDFNNDTFDDLIMPQLTFATKTPAIPIMFKNNGAGDFTLVTSSSGLDLSLYLVGTAADYDNDGNLDLFLTSAGAQNFLFKGNGDFTFTKVASPVTESVPNSFNYIDLGASWVDYNKDGLMDLYVVPNTEKIPAKLFTQGPKGSFTKVTTGALASVMVQGASALWADYDNDGDQDVFITDGNSSMTNQLFRNNGDNTFTRVTGAPFDTDVNQNSFGAAWGDYNNDGFLDLFITANSINLLYKNNGNGTFTKQSMPTTVTETKVANVNNNAAAWGDVNNDGFIDLIVSSNNGENLFYINSNGTSFTKVKNEKLNDIKRNSFGLGFSDYNKDGFLDLALSIVDLQFQNGGAPGGIKNELFKNNNVTGNWTEIKLTGTSSNALAIGARVTLVAGAKTQIREVSSSASFSSQNSQVVHFGLGANTTITSLQVKWPSGIVQTLSNITAINQIITIIEDNIGPIATTLTPANGASNVNAIATLSIGLNETSTGVATKNVKLFKTSDLVNPVATFDASTGAVNGNVSTFTPLQNLLPSTSYSVSVDAGAFKDIYGNPSLAIGTSSWQFTSAAGPVVSLLNPLNNAITVAINTPIEITFNKAPTPVAGKKISVFIQGSGSPEFSLDATTGAVAGNKISFTPPAPLGYLNIYDVVVDVGAFTDQFGNATLAIGWTFTTTDNVAPVITFTPPAQMNKGAVSSALFSATVTDNSGTVSSTVLSWRKIGGGTFTNLVGGFNSTTQNWDFAVTESMPDGNGLEYFITAKDPANNVGRLPLDPNTNFYIYLGYPTAQSIIPSSVLGLGGQKENWKIFTVPFELGSNNGISAVLDEFSTLTYKTDWRMLSYKDDVAWGEYPGDFSTFTRGKGYFINIKTAPAPLKIGDVVAPSNNRNTLFQLNLKKGWNEVGNPYLTPISWADVAAFPGNNLTGTAAQLKTFSSGNYGNGTTLQPFEGGFVFVSSDVTVSIPFSGQTAIGGRSTSLIARDLGQDQWQLNLSMKQGELVNELSAIGMQPNATLTMDQFDDVNPPRFFNYLEMDFPHPEFFAKNFSVDVVPTQSEYTWEFSVQSNQAGTAELSWDNTSFGNSSKELFLFDIEQQTPINMRTRNHYNFNPGESQRFRIYFGEHLGDKLRPDHVMLGKAFPNPTTGMTAIPFSLPGYTASFRVKLEVYDLLGNKVATLADGDFAPGFYTSEWNTTVSNTSDGLYIYRMIVADQNKNIIQTGKVVLKK